MPPATVTPTPSATDAHAVVTELVHRARAAQRTFERSTQEEIDEAVTAVAWACCEPGRAAALARVAVDTTGLGRFEDKVAKNTRKTIGTLSDLQGAKSVGVIAEDPETGITEIAKPVGVVAAVCPSTNPSATPTNKAMMALKGGNAVIIAPSPKGAETCELLLSYIHIELTKIGAPPDLVQMLPAPIDKQLTNELMRQCDLVVATGSQNNVRAAYSSGTPAIGVGGGNVPVIVDDSGDLADAADKIRRSKTFDYATSCSSENAVLIHAAVYDDMLAALEREGGCLLDADEAARLQRAMWPDGKLSRDIVAQPPAAIAAAAGIERPEARGAEFLMVEETGVGPDHPFSGEKLSVVLTVYRVEDFAGAIELTQRILDFMGSGHSVGIHTADESHALELAHTMRVARVLVNQAHCFGNGGSFDNGLNFTLTMGCGTWAGNSISENLSYKHFLNTTRLARVIPGREPTHDELFGDYLRRHGG
jgi:sulfoacetaldehyde dehydrogenase